MIDFGIAKTLAFQLKVEPSLTAHDQFVGTPAYMSPEQVEMIGIDVDTRSDVYSLGVLLYELLTSHTPFDRQALADSGVAAMRRMILKHGYLKPSARLAELPENDLKTIATARQSDPSRLIATIFGDLDWIVMKALEKDRNSRYETANGFALDLKRYLEDKPVSARRPSNMDAFRKFVRRNRISFYSAVALAVSIFLGFGTSTVLYFREKTALVEQERLSLEAEKSRDQELHLRRQAQARANVSRAVFLLSEGHVEEADELLRTSPLESIEPSREAASVFRVLGNWYATYGKWPDAVRCFHLMWQATTMHSSEEILRGSDLLITAPALLENGDEKAYDAFREKVTTRYLPVANSLAAEHTLKACLLRKASPDLLLKLRPAALMCENSITGRATRTFPAWEAFSLALYYHRQENYEKVLQIGSRGLSEPNVKEICAACIQCLTAIAHHRLGDDKASAADFSAAASVVRRPPASDSSEEKSISPRWYDAAVGSILLQEAENSIHTPR